MESAAGRNNNGGQNVLTDRKLLSILFDYLNPNEDGSLHMFFASKKVFANIDVTVARIQDSEDRERQNARHQNTLRVDTLQRKATNRETELTNDTPSFM